MAVGLFGPIGPALMVAVMIVAAVSVHWQHGLFAGSNGIEVPLLYGAGAAALALTGPGLYSLDAALGLAGTWTPALDEIVLAIGIAGGILSLLVRRAQPAQTAVGASVRAGDVPARSERRTRVSAVAKETRDVRSTDQTCHSHEGDHGRRRREAAARLWIRRDHRVRSVPAPR
jgi:putative oxidoreductase